MKKCVCESCRCQADCAWNNWCLFDSENKQCPNYEEGMKLYAQFEKDFKFKGK